MAGDPLIEHPGENDYNLLHMPGYRQPQSAPECILYALWIVIQYIANQYPDKTVRDKTDPVTLDTIQEYIDIGQDGWENPGQEPLTSISSQVGSMELTIDYRYNGFPQDIDEFASDSIDELLPMILFVDQLLMKNGERGEGPMHAVVICGLGDEHITIEDPLVEGTTTVKIDKLNEAWDPEFNTVIEVNLQNGLEPTRREKI